MIITTLRALVGGRVVVFNAFFADPEDDAAASLGMDGMVDVGAEIDRLETENIEDTKSNILYSCSRIWRALCFPGRSAICCRLPGSTTCGDVTLGGASTDTVSDVCTVKSLTVSGDTTLLANVIWARRAPTLSRCGAPVTLGDASAVVVR